MRFIIYQSRHVSLKMVMVYLACCFAMHADGQCGGGVIFSNDYSIPANWTYFGSQFIAPPNNNGNIQPGTLQVNASTQRLEYINFRPRQTRRLARSLSGALNGSQNQFRFEFDFTITSTNIDMAATLLAVTQNTNHPYTNMSGSTVETNNNTVEVRLSNPLGTGTGYRLHLTSKIGVTRGLASAFITINPNVQYWARLQRMNANQATLHIYTNAARTVLWGQVCVQIDPGINGLNWVQHAGVPSTGWSRSTSLTLDNLCLYPTVVGNVCNFCPPSVTVTSALDCSTGIISATATPSGGAAPYAYLWNTGANTATIAPLSPGLYTVTVTDASGCTVPGSVNIPVNPGITANVSTQNAGCDGGCDGSITVSGVTGGTPPYTYKIDGVVLPGLTFNNLCPGLHTLVIEDASGCRIQYDPQIAVESGCWQQTTFNNSSVDHGNDIENDQDGNIYVVGDYMDATNFQCNSYGVPTATNPVSLNGDKGMYLTKYGPCGEVRWTAYSVSNAPGQWANATAIELDEVNQVIYVTGEFKGANVTIRGGDGSSAQTPMNGYSDNMYIAKFDMVTGQVFWMLDHTDPATGNYIPKGICHNGTDVFVGGQQDMGGLWVSFVMKASVSGIPYVAYATTLPDKDCFVEDIELQSTGDMVIVGRYRGQIGMSLAGVLVYPITSGSGGTLFDGFVSGLSDAGNLAQQNWIYTTMANTGDGELYDASIDDNDNIFVAGTVRGSTANSFVHTGTSVSLPNGNITQSAIIARLNSSGTWGGSSWMNYSEPGNSQAKGKGIDVENDIVAVNGNHINNVPFEFYSAGPNTLNGPTIPVNNNNTVWVAQMSDLGNVLDLNITEGNGVQNAEAIATGEVFCHSTGDYNNDLIIPPNMYSSGAVYNGGAFPNTKAFTIRNLIVLPGIPFMKPGHTEIANVSTEAHSDIKIYPNPATDEIIIESNHTDADIVLYSVTGQKIKSFGIKKGLPSNINISELPQGVYILKTKNTTWVARFVKK